MTQCKGVARSTGVRCKIKKGLDERGYCKHHCLPKCQGFKIGTDIPCSNLAKTGSDFCCMAHEFPEEYISPRVLHPLDVHFRRHVQADVVARWDGQDVYNQQPLDLDTPYALDLDHIAEKQVFTTALSMTDLRNGDADLALATEVLRDEVVNKLDNLCLTHPITNRTKGPGVRHFMDDWRSGHLAGKNFTTYLLDEQYTGDKRRISQRTCWTRSTPLTREVTKRITREMGRAMKWSQRKLSNEGDTPVLERVSEQLQKIYVAMDLKEIREKRSGSHRSSSRIAR